MSETANTPSGRLTGTRRRGVLVFRGIPFARPPVGPLRFRAPEPFPRWLGERPALVHGPSAPQSGADNPLVRRFVGSPGGQSEDCLYLNVWTPALDGRRRPVLVFIHGGAFLVGSGSSPLYEGTRLARRGDVVVVTLNYRLGALGSLALAGVLPGDAPANLALRDQVAALAWVRDHVAAFGGDPENVTVFGESAGAMSIGALLGAPEARPLFRRAILQSGAAHNVSSAEHARRVAEVFLKQLGAHGRDLETLRAAPLAELLRAQLATVIELAPSLGGLPFQPSVDDDFLPRHPLAEVEAGGASGIALLAGTNRDEWKLFLLGDRRGRRMDEAALRRRFTRLLGESESERAYEAYLRAHESHAPHHPRERWSSFQGDRVFHWPAARLLELQSRHAPVYAYRFDWSPPLLRGTIGACHGIELPFVFGAVLEPWLRPWLGAAPGTARIAHQVQEAWLAFARTGQPGHPGLPFWPQHDAERRQVMALARRSRVEPGFAGGGLAYWRESTG
jgi:para-nitrobenzyl esterase